MKKAEEIIKKISENTDLNFEESKSIFLDIMSGNIKDDEDLQLKEPLVIYGIIKKSLI